MRRFTEERNGENVIPLRNAVCGIDMPHWKINEVNDLESFLSGDAVDRLAEYENADVEGRMIVLPCKIGDTVWVIRNYRGVNHPQLGEVSEMFFDVDMALQIVVKHIGRGKFGEKVFRTLEEAEQALKGECK